MTRESDRSAAIAELEKRWGEGLSSAQRQELRGLLDALVADWEREAGDGPDAASITEELSKELEGKARRLAVDERLPALRLELLARRIRRLSARTFALGTAILEGSAGPAAAKADGQRLLKEAEDLGDALKAMPESDDTRRLHRDLGEALMEALFAVEGKAMSQRLSRQAGGRSGPGEAPNVRPG